MLIVCRALREPPVTNIAFGEEHAAAPVLIHRDPSVGRERPVVRHPKVSRECFATSR